MQPAAPIGRRQPSRCIFFMPDVGCRAGRASWGRYHREPEIPMSTTARSARQSGKTVTARPSDRELTLTRVYDAPPETLYRAWTDPAMLKRWIAPRPYETVRAEMDVRPDRKSTRLNSSH